MKHAAALHCTSATERDQTLKMRLQVPVEVVPNCVAIPDLPERGKLRSRMGLGARDKLSLYAGRLHKEKRIDLVVESFASVSARNPDSYLAIVGADYGERARLEAVR